VRVGEAHFGGPDRAPGLLRDLLAERIAAVPAGGSILWVTYYFRDRRLAADLIGARRRGVDVRVTLDASPRTPHANRAVIELLSESLGEGLRVVRGPMDGKPLGKLLRPRLHEKLYCFSHPEPVAILGSFNPSGDNPEEEPEVIAEIGDHDRGHNLLVELRDPKLVAALGEHARRLHASRHGPLDRFTRAANRALVGDRATVHFWPRLRRDPIIRWLGRLSPGSRLRLAASHISGPTSRRILRGLAARGVALEILTEATHRRVPPEMERSLSAVGIPIRRLSYPQWLPMHNKFALVESGDERSLIFGSFNWSEPSRRLNREIGVITPDPELFAAFASRWDQLWREAVSQT
jgi:phosphatidylserine/phosphatidylglycerophosphate/cardiolipin synthase-like enzyme